jgi:polysaccharide pyruvyl transferase WcaK-like protein
VKSILETTFNNPDFVYISPVEEDVEVVDRYGIKVIYGSKKDYMDIILNKLLFFPLRRNHSKEILACLQSSDLVIDLWGISFADTLGSNSFIARFVMGFHYLAAKLCRTKVIKYTADLGPFNRFWNRIFAYIYYNFFIDLILARSEECLHNIKKLGVKTPIRVFPDTAFLLDYEETDFSKKISSTGNPVIGVSASFKAAMESKDPEKYISTMAKIIDNLIEKNGSNIVLIPNDIDTDPRSDDRQIVKRIFEKVLKKDNIFVIDQEYSAKSLKGIIHKCDAVIASRYHTIVASLSLAIPVLAIGWHYKYIELLSLFNLEKFVVGVDDLNLEEVNSLFDQLWDNRINIKKDIELKLIDISNEILQGGKFIRDELGLS